MVYVYVFLAALAVGGAVFWLTLRAEQSRAISLDGDGFLPNSRTASTLPDGIYVPVTADDRSWQTRLSGFLGLIIAVALAAAGLAFAVYQLGAFIARLITSYAR
jgi:hypothetical protein